MPATGSKSIINYKLSIRLCADGFCFLVYSAGSGQLLFTENVHCGRTESMPECLERGMNLSRIKGRTFERVTLYSTLPSTRLPLDEFRREDMLALYRMTFAGTQVRYEDMRSQVLPSLEVVEIFPLQNQIEQMLHTHYPNALVRSLYGSLLEQVAEMQQGNILPVTFNTIIQDDWMMIVVLKKGRLSYANVFHVKGDADRLYYTLLIWKSLELDAWHDCCYLYGASDNLKKELKRFLYNMEVQQCVL